MDQKDKALKVALTAIAILAFTMFAYYWVSWRTRKTDNDVNFADKGETQKEEKSEFAGVWSASDPIEGQNLRLAFISLNKRDDTAGGYFGTAKVDPIGSDTESSSFLKCNDVSIAEKDFFVKCTDPALGQISFTGEWSRTGGSIQVSGKFLWTNKDGAEVTNKATTLTHTGA